MGTFKLADQELRKSTLSAIAPYKNRTFNHDQVTVFTNSVYTLRTATDSPRLRPRSANCRMPSYMR